MLTSFLVPKKWERLTPITLTREKPVAEFKLDFLGAFFVFNQPVNNLLFGIFRFEAIEKTGVDGSARISIALPILIAIGLHDLDDWKVEFFRKFKVPLIMCRHSHDSATAVAHHDVISDPDWDFFAVYRINRKSSGGDTSLFFIKASVHVRFRSTCFSIGFDGLFIFSSRDF